MTLTKVIRNRHARSLRASVAVRTCERMMFEEAAPCAPFGHNRAKSGLSVSMPRVHLYQSVPKCIVREFNSIANTKLVKDSIELDFHSSLGNAQ